MNSDEGLPFWFVPSQVEARFGEAAYPEELLLRLDEPAPGLAHLFAVAVGGQVLLSIRFFHYGSTAAAAALEAAWGAWV